jgi:pimeloyl-ACP methyl ester carboxylesterase
MIRLIRLGKQSDQPPLFAIPGIDGTIGSFQPILTRLAEKREVVVVDYSSENNAALEGLSAEIAALIQAENHTAIDVLGQSIGTVLAAQIVSDYGLPIRKVVLCCTFTHLRWTLLRLSAAFVRNTPRWLYRLTSRASVIVTSGPVGDGWNHPTFEAARDIDPAALPRRTLWEVDRDFAADLVKVVEPLLILMGEQDRFVPNAQREVEKLRGIFTDHRAQVEVIPNAGHIFMPSTAITLASDKINTFLE